MSPLNKCKNYTYDDNGNYKPNNRVIAEFLLRVLPKIKAAQDTAISNYAQNCVSDVNSCLNDNDYDPTQTDSVNKIPLNACKTIITTCQSVNGENSQTQTQSELLTWVASLYNAANQSGTSSGSSQNNN